jgi:hypothetical protein
LWGGVGGLGCMNWWHGSVKCPADRACTVTKGEVGDGSVGGADDMAGDEGGLVVRMLGSRSEVS